ncbi:MAG: hypothetical protein OXT73_11055 [Bacteroidota bacterium]|nr:hypothetical protein [Bacteroidota bacterium]
MESFSEKPAHATGSNRVAWLVGMLINPLTLAPVLMGLIGVHAGLTGEEVTLLVLVATGGYLVLPVLMLLYMKKRGRIQSLEARDPSERRGPLYMGVVILLVAGAACVMVVGSEKRLFCIASGVLILHLLLAIWITPRIKLSLHTASAAGLLSMIVALEWFAGHLMPLGGALYLILALIIPLVMWARLADGAHTRAEVVAGLLFGLFLPPGLLWLLDMAWLLV